MVRSDVLIVGAGPTGLTLALWLTRQGVAVRLIDRTARAGTASRALDVQARTLELYGQLGLADAVLARGHVTPAIGLWVKGCCAGRLPFADLGRGLTPYPFLHSLAQDEHELLLVARLEELGGHVERCTELLDFTQTGDGVTARLRHADGSDEICTASFIAGCDGANSLVRRQLAIGFPGGTSHRMFYVADVEADGPTINGELNVDLDEADFLGVFPLAGAGRARIYGTVRDERADRGSTLQFADVGARAVAHLNIAVRAVNWFSTYSIHHRVADHLRQGRAFLLGDAAHVHSPTGGQGMNTGIGDAINLAWKLAAVLNGQAPDRLLDSYEAERLPFARRLVATTDRLFRFATSDGPLATVVRTRIAPRLLGRLTRSKTFRTFIFCLISQIMLNYRHGPLSLGRAGKVHGGDRLPWVPGASFAADGADNFTALAHIGWQVQIYGTATASLQDWCRTTGVRLQVSDWSAAHARAGLRRDAAYLLRPDSYVAVVATRHVAARLQAYADTRGLTLATAESDRLRPPLAHTGRLAEQRSGHVRVTRGAR